MPGFVQQQSAALAQEGQEHAAAQCDHDDPPLVAAEHESAGNTAEHHRDLAEHGRFCVYNEVECAQNGSPEENVGGTYITTSGEIKQVDNIQRTIVLMDGTVIPIEDILEIKSTFDEDELR